MTVIFCVDELDGDAEEGECVFKIQGAEETLDSSLER